MSQKGSSGSGAAKSFAAPDADWNIPHWGALAIITAFALPLFLELLGHGQATAMMELFNLVPIREAYRDGHWLIPTLGGMPRLEKPPLPVWIPAALAMVFHSDNLWVSITKLTWAPITVKKK